MSERKTTKQKKELFLSVFEKNGCYIKKAADTVGITRQLFYHWQKNDQKFADTVEEIREGMIDFVENSLLKKINEGDTTSIIFFLKTRGKERGYVEKTEQVVEQNTTITEIKIIEE